ncbi:MAG: hypothetical protein K9W43_12655 [Candidatus Thorarchaeota archaeon]|nr:hypothetical protein [Candidatus Thorarchaeota archaeon]
MITINPKDLCLRLVQAKNEHEVITILKQENLWDNPDVWKPYGDNENNWSTINNQQTHAEGALVEKIVNAIDALLMRDCLLRGIDPSDPLQAPQSISEAVESFFGVRSGAIESLNRSKRAELAREIYIVATGKASTQVLPCISIIDKGEGQSPNKFQDTFMSLHRGNKARIPFVQGRYNMGGSGVFTFCGDHYIQLVVSRRHPTIAASEEETDPSVHQWGFTITRVFLPEGTMKNPVIKYLAPEGKILRFDAESLPLLPGKSTGKKPPEAYKQPIEWGTYIKLFDYKLSRGYKSIIRINLFYRLSLLLPRLALPVRLVETRPYKTDKFETTLAGLEIRLKDNAGEVIEQGFPISESFTVDGEPLTASIYVFQKSDTAKSYRYNDGVVFVLDGQTQGVLSKTLFKSEKVNLAYIADSLLVLVDCSRMNRSISSLLFMASRDRLKDIEFKDHLRERIIEILRDNRRLRELNHERRKQQVQKRIKEAKPLELVLKRITKHSPGVLHLLNPGQRIKNPFDLRSTTSDHREVYRGKQWPSFFRLVSASKKHVPQGNKFRMEYETDAANDYFDRADSPGQFHLSVDNPDIEIDYHIGLLNGTATLTVQLPSDIPEGTILSFTSFVTDIFHSFPESDEITATSPPFTDTFTIIVDPPQPSASGGPSSRRQPRSTKIGDGRQTPKGLDIPQIFFVTREEWDQYGWDKFDALEVRPNGEQGIDFFVNADNVFLLQEIKQRSDKDPEEIRQQFAWGLVLLGLSIIQEKEAIPQRTQNKQNPSYNEEDHYELAGRIARTAALVVLALINDL